EVNGRDLLINADPKGGWGVALKKTEDEFKRQGEHLSNIADAVRDLGLKVSMHNHADDKHNAEGDLRSGIEYSSKEVGLCIDTDWAHVAGMNPLQWIEKYPERVYSFHLRNQHGASPSENITSGDIAMQKLIHMLSDINYQGWLTFELWHREDNQPQRSLVEDTKISIDYLIQALQAYVPGTRIIQNRTGARHQNNSESFRCQAPTQSVQPTRLS